MAYYDDDIIDDRYGGFSGNFDVTDAIDESAVVIDSRSLQRSTRGLRKISSHKTAKDYFEGLIAYINNLSNAAAARALPKVAQDILNGYVRYNAIDKSSGFGYNDYYGALIHNYYASVVVGGRRLKGMWRVQDKYAGKWGKAIYKKSTSKKGKRIFRLMSRRHAVIKHYENLRWHVGKKFGYGGWNKKEEKDSSKKYWWGRELNWRGRRLKGRTNRRLDAHDNEIVTARNAFKFLIPGHGFVYNYGRKRGDYSGRGTMRPYYKKHPDRHPKDVKVKRGNYRYYNRRVDPYARRRFTNSSSLGGRTKFGIEIFNTSPYAARLEQGFRGKRYTVLPAYKARVEHGRMIAKLMKKDFDKFLK